MKPPKPSEFYPLENKYRTDSLDDNNYMLAFILPEIERRINTNPTTFNLWFGDLKIRSLNERKVVFTTPTDLRRRILMSRYYDAVCDAVEAVMGFRMHVEIVSDEKMKDLQPENEPSAEEEEQTRKEREERAGKINAILNADDSKSGGDSKSVISEYTFDNFIEGASNKFARAACLAVAKEPTTYNPLFIYGHSGLGKTHLLYAIINYIRKHHPNKKIVYKTSEDFINELIAAIQNGSTAEFKSRYRTADILLIDDIQFIADKVATQEEFFHTFSALYESDKQIILTSDRPPKEIRPLEDRLRTRFEGGLLADVQPPSFELRIAIIKKKAAAMNLTLDNEIIEYIAGRLQNNIRQIEGVIKKLSAISVIENCVIDKEIVNRVLSIIDPGNVPTDVLVEQILTVVARNYGVSVDDLKSKKKTDEIANARHVAIYIIRKLTDMPLKAIGEIFHRDHTTILASVNKVEINCRTVAHYQENIISLIKQVKK